MRVLLLMPTNTYHAADFVNAAEHLGVDVSVGTNGSQALRAKSGEGLSRTHHDNCKTGQSKCKHQLGIQLRPPTALQCGGKHRPGINCSKAELDKNGANNYQASVHHMGGRHCLALLLGKLLRHR